MQRTRHPLGVGVGQQAGDTVTGDDGHFPGICQIANTWSTPSTAPFIQRTMSAISLAPDVRFAW